MQEAGASGPRGAAAGKDDDAAALSAARRDLERAFDDKVRDLKAQHKRVMDKLQQDRLDWEEHRRTQQSELAARVEKVRRQEDNHRRDQQALREAQAKLEQTRAELESTRIMRAEAKAIETGKTADRQALAAWRGLAGIQAFVGIATLAAAVLLLALGEPFVALVIAAIGLAASLALELRRRRLSNQSRSET